MKEGNGDPNICLFPEAITPNHHALAREFVLLDNFYVESEVSADGHEWSMGAYATDFVERIWPLGYRGDRRVPYPAEGRVRRVARPAGGYLWDKAAEKGVSYRSYGEWVANGKTPADPATASVKALEGHFDPMFRSFDMDYPDVKRADRFLEELAGFEKAGEMPRLVILRLPNDHTSGTTPGKWTVTACVGDNDLALGRLVEGLSQEPVLEEAGHLRGRGRRPKRLGPRRCPPDRRPGDQSLHQAPLGRFDDVQHVVDAPHHGADPRPGSDVAIRRGRAADVQLIHAPSPTSRPYVHRPARVDINARNTRRRPWPRSRCVSTWKSRIAPTTCSSTRSSGRPSREPTRSCRRRSARRSCCRGGNDCFHQPINSTASSWLWMKSSACCRVKTAAVVPMARTQLAPTALASLRQSSSDRPSSSPRM